MSLNPIRMYRKLMMDMTQQQAAKYTSMLRVAYFFSAGSLLMAGLDWQKKQKKQAAEEDEEESSHE